MTREEITQAMTRACRELYERGYTYSTGGNASHRSGDGFLVTSGGSTFAALGPPSFVQCDLDGRATENQAQPSKEAPFHAAIYRRRPDVRAVIHLYAPSATTLSALAAPTEEGNVLPVVTAYSAMRVGRVPMVDYVTPGTQGLADRVEKVCLGVNAVLLQNHGIVTLAESLESAVAIAEEAEMTIRIWLATGGSGRVLSDDDLLAASNSLAPIAPGSQRPALLRGIGFGAFKSWNR